MPHTAAKSAAQTLSSTDAPTADFAVARFYMIEGQLRPNKVTHSGVIAAMGSLPRELFVPSTLVGMAYIDENIPLIAGRSLMQPMILARMIQEADIKPTDRVLDLAPATGYSTLVLASLAAQVVGVEPNSVLEKEAEANIAKFAGGKAEILAGAPVEGCASRAPFDVIFINGSVEFIPEILFDQLAEGGRLVAVVRGYGPAHAAHAGQARLYRKQRDEVSWVSLFDANVGVAPGFTAPRGFEF
ncbi:MAG: protein-L-isoaspartate O-methyltransferase [Alphaproteobacteria bacterium]|nr:protein-L-isoaspartate O-methyltransferase [Alphaproteobacteria bacterium]